MSVNMKSENCELVTIFKGLPSIYSFLIIFTHRGNLNEPFL